MTFETEEETHPVDEEVIVDLEDEKQAREAAAALVESAKIASFSEDVSEIIARVIATATPTERLQVLSERLAAYLNGNQAAAYALLLLCSFPSEETEELVPVDSVSSTEQSSALRAVVRRISGMYGGDLERAFTASEFDPGNWSDLVMRYSFIPGDDLWRAELEITRFDETSFGLDGPADSFLRLVNYMVQELTRMPADAKDFGEELDQFRQVAADFLGQYQDPESD